MLKVEPVHSSEKIDKFRDFRLAAYDLPLIQLSKGWGRMVIGVGRSVIDSASCNLFQRSGVLKTKLPKHVSITFHHGLEQSLQGTQSEASPQSHICCVQVISTYDTVVYRDNHIMHLTILHCTMDLCEANDNFQCFLV